MKFRYIIIFLLCVMILAVSEYIFLEELNSQQRLFILLLTTIVAIGCIIAIFFCYRRIGKEV